MSRSDKKDQPHICIIGAGAAGLSAGWYLKERGYNHVTILEKEARIGGKCHTITYGGKSFDLGANYITSGYTEVMALARKFNAEMYTEGSLRAFDVDNKKFTGLLKAVLRNTSLWRVGWQSVKYIYKRWRLNGIISTSNPGFGKISAYKDLTASFENWLEKNDLKDLETIFEVPISLMGYGQLRQIPAAYALTYLSVSTFLDLIFAALNPSIRGYPKRFKEGYQRLWEKISWELDVTPGAQVESIERNGKIVITYSAIDDFLFSDHKTLKKISCDYVILACPLYGPVLEKFMTFTTKEAEVFGKKDQIIYDPFIVTTYNIPGSAAFFAATYMLPETNVGQPFVITRQFKDNYLVSFYTRTKFCEHISKETILAQNVEFAKNNFDIELGPYETYSEFPYFQHVNSEVMSSGFYDKLEALQGDNNTFYTGGLMNFELVETITNYSKHLIKKYFPPIK